MLLQFNGEPPEPKLPDRCCSNCAHYKVYIYQYDDAQIPATYGECRRYPPKRLVSDEDGFPLVEEDVWCGEFEVK